TPGLCGIHCPTWMIDTITSKPTTPTPSRASGAAAAVRATRSALPPGAAVVQPSETTAEAITPTAAATMNRNVGATSAAGPSVAEKWPFQGKISASSRPTTAIPSRRRSGQGTARAGAGGATNPGSTCPVGYGAGGATIACAPVATWCGGRGTASAASPDAVGSSPLTFCLPIAGPGRVDRSPAPDSLARRGGVHHRSFARHSLDRQRGRGPLGQEAGQRGGPVGVGRRRATGGTGAGGDAAEGGAVGEQCR